MKKILSILLIAALLFGALALGASAQPAAALYQIYGDGMLFRQNAPATLAGTAADGAVIRAALYAADGSLAAQGEAVAADGTFAVSFDAPAGSFAEYRVELTADGAPFRTLTGVVFGELWLAAGQSNMEYPYAQAEGYVAPQDSRTDAKAWVRLLLTPSIPQYKGSSELQPALPQTDIPGCYWCTANDEAAVYCSAVGYWFITDLAERLDVPVGLANIPLGGSSILTWLSRETVENDAEIAAVAKEKGLYHSLAEWDESNVNAYGDVTTMFNLKLAPLKPFKPSGLIWYQGETEIFYDWAYGQYSHAFDLMQDLYTDYFGLPQKMPFIYTQLASYYYRTNEDVSRFNLEMTDMQQARPDSRAMVTGYDFAPAYFEGPGAIHPKDKQHLGLRMSLAAQGLVYGQNDTYTAANMKESRVADGGVYVTFNDVGDGLVCGGTALNGFAVAGENGVYTAAQAEIVSSDTVFVHSDSVPLPAAAAYACAISNDNANLYATLDGEKTMPASPFITDSAAEAQWWQRNAWMDCEEAQSWHNLAHNGESEYYDNWTASGAAIAFDGDSAFAGANGMRVTAEKRHFSVSPMLTYKHDAKTLVFEDNNNDWSGYGALTFAVRNDGSAPVTLESFRLVVSPATVFTPAVQETGAKSAEIPADGEWHTVTLDLNALHLAGAQTGAVFSNESLTEVKKVTVRFACDEGDAALALDDFRFTPEETDAPKLHFDKLYSWLARLLQTLKTALGQFINKVC